LAAFKPTAFTAAPKRSPIKRARFFRFLAGFEAFAGLRFVAFGLAACFAGAAGAGAAGVAAFAAARFAAAAAAAFFATGFAVVGAALFAGAAFAAGSFAAPAAFAFAISMIVPTARGS